MASSNSSVPWYNRGKKQRAASVGSSGSKRGGAGAGGVLSDRTPKAGCNTAKSSVFCKVCEAAIDDQDCCVECEMC